MYAVRKSPSPVCYTYQGGTLSVRISDGLGSVLGFWIVGPHLVFGLGCILRIVGHFICLGHWFDDWGLIGPKGPLMIFGHGLWAH